MIECGGLLNGEGEEGYLRGSTACDHRPHRENQKRTAAEQIAWRTKQQVASERYERVLVEKIREAMPCFRFQFFLVVKISLLSLISALPFL